MAQSARRPHRWNYALALGRFRLLRLLILILVLLPYLWRLLIVGQRRDYVLHRLTLHWRLLCLLLILLPHFGRLLIVGQRRDYVLHRLTLLRLIWLGLIGLSLAWQRPVRKKRRLIGI